MFRLIRKIATSVTMAEDQTHIRFRVREHESRTMHVAFWRKNPPETTIIYRSDKCCGHLVVFVHGFNGSACSTWSQFPERTLDNPVFRDVDVVFYGYDGIRQQAQDSGDEFYRFVNRLILHPLDGILENVLPLLERSTSFSYKRITFVAHSLGAVVTRIALLDAYQENRPWLAKSELVLYAPAHMGSRIRKLAAEALIGIPYVAGVGAIAAGWFKILNDLEEESQLLKLLREQTLEAEKKTPQLRAKAVVVSKADDVVINTRFPNDPVSDHIDSATHITICKPRAGFLGPAQFLYANLR